MDVIKNLEEFIDGQTLKVRQKVRDKAIKKADVASYPKLKTKKDSIIES